MYTVYKCTLCKTDHSSKSDWLQHLTGKGHQVEAKRKCVKEWAESKVKECLLVIYANFPMETGKGAAKIVQHFSKDPTTFVTDFVCWEERPHVGILQLESRKAVKKVLDGARGSKVYVDKEKMEIRAGEKLGKLEWLAMMPPTQPKKKATKESSTTPRKMEVQRDQTRVSASVKRKLELEQETPSALSEPPKLGTDLNIATGSTPIWPWDKNALALEQKLQEFAQNQGWSRAEYKFKSKEDEQHSGKCLWTCELTLNGVTYQSGRWEEQMFTALGKMIGCCLHQLIKDAKRPKLSTRDPRTKVVVVEAEHHVAEMDTNPQENRAPVSRVSKRAGQEIPIAGPRPKVSKTIDDQIPANFFPARITPTILLEYCLRRGWKPPIYEYKEESKGENETVWICHVIVNGITYETKWKQTNRPKECKVAAFCLRQMESLSFQSRTTCVESLIFPLFSACWGTPCNSEKGSVSYQFRLIQNSVTIPIKTYAKLLVLWGNVQSLFRGLLPTAQVVLFRRFHLRLSYHPGQCHQKLLFFVYDTRSPPDMPNSFSSLSDSQVQNILQLPEGKELQKLKTIFTVVSSPKYFVEVQVCRLLEYMITFDPRVYPLIILMFHWTLVNGLSFEEPYQDSYGYQGLPAPLALGWMVLHFFCNKGLIPTVREIQARPHQDVDVEPDFGIDVGFSADPEFAQEWRRQRNVECDYSSDEFLLGITQLFGNFLQFYGELSWKSSWILNTKDGEIISATKFEAENPTPYNSTSSWSSKMKENELLGLRVIQEPKSNFKELEERTGLYKGCNYKVNFNERKLYMVHPFLFTRRFILPRNMSAVLEAMSYTGKKVEDFINMAKESGIKCANNQLGTLANLMTVSDKIRARITC